jgi:folate-dependent phosphoribosylglycinamide formyltransferase PurN
MSKYKESCKLTDLQLQMEEAKRRVNIIDKNGPSGEHYDLVDVEVESAEVTLLIEQKKTWIAMFSQSGSEIANLAAALGYWPDLIITNNSDKSKWDPRIVDRIKFVKKVMVVSNNQAKTANFLHNVEGSKSALITLHGWLRIIPAVICEQYKIVNGHPGLINLYPELKGKDPQERWWADRNKYDFWYGSVVHDVVSEVDAGQIHTITKCKLTAYEELYYNLYDLFRRTSLNSWLKYFYKFPIR